MPRVGASSWCLQACLHRLLFGLKRDPFELCNVYAEHGYRQTIRDLTSKLECLQDAYGDQPRHYTNRLT